MQDASDESEESSDNTDSIPYTDESSSCSYVSSHSDCFSGGWSDSEWTDENGVEPKKMKLDIVDHDLSPHEQLHRAIKLHDCEMVHKLLEDGVQPCTTYKHNSSCFVLAVESKCILNTFLTLEPSGINCQDSDGSTLLMLSTKETIFNFLCKYKPDVNLLDNYGDNILHHTLKQCIPLEPSKLKRILKLGIDVNAVDGIGETALAIAIKGGKKAYIVEMLLDRGATLPPTDAEGKTAVMHAIENEHEVFSDKVEVLKVLFKHGADVVTKDNDGHNAMYYLISECIPGTVRFRYESRNIEEIMILLLERNCEVQGLDRAYGGIEIIGTDGLIRNIPVSYDMISTLVHYTMRIELLKKLLKRGLYSSTTPNPNVLSPLSALLMRAISPSTVRLDSCRRILETAKEMILFGADTSQRIWHEWSCPSQIEALEYKHRTRAEYQAAVAKELDIPDALFFVANMRIFSRDLPFEPNQCPNHEIKNFKLAMEEVLRLLLRFWPHPPLLLMLFRVDPVWCPSLITKTGIDSGVDTGMYLIMELLAKIGGPLPLGTRYYTILKSALQRMAEKHDLCKPMLNLLSQPDGGIPTLRNLSHAAFRATVNNTDPSGLDFSEYRVLCQGQMVPLPEKIVNFLEFRV